MKNKIYSVLFIALMLLMFLPACKKNNYKYQMSVEKTFKMMKDTKVLPIEQLAEIVISQDTDKYQFVDVRTPHQFAVGHLYKAINLPFKSLEENCDALCDNSKTFLIYGDDASQARLAYDFLKQLGINNVIAVGGGYDFVYHNIVKSFGIHSATYDDEIAKYDFAKVIAETAGVSGGNTNGGSTPPPAPIVVKRKKTEGNVGGCE